VTAAWRPWLLLGLAAAALASPATAETLAYVPPACAPSEPTSEAELLRCFAPVVISEGAEQDHNRIGAPELERGLFGWLDARVDPERPVLYAEVLHDALAGRELLHLVYRMHFSKIPLRLSPHVFEAHRNAGLLLLVTLDAASREPLFVTSVHTCGCYRALIPTTRVPDDHLPPSWPAELRVHGHTLPARLPPPVAGTRPVVLTLTADRHRVSDVRVGTLDGVAADARAAIALEPLAQLRDLPIAGESGRASLFHSSWLLRGRVIRDSYRIEQYEIGDHAFPDQAAVANAHVGRGKTRELAHRLLK